MPKARNINSAIPTSPDGFKFLGTKNGELSSTSLDTLLKNTDIVQKTVSRLEEQYNTKLSGLQKDMSELESNFNDFKLAFEALNEILSKVEVGATPSEETTSVESTKAEETTKSKKKSKKASE